MHDHSLFVRKLSEFTTRMLSPYDVDVVLNELMERLGEVLGLAGSGVALSPNGRLEFSTAVPSCIAEVELVQIERQSGPCVDSYRSGTVVAITDLMAHRDRWPDYCAVAERLGLGSVAGIPMRLPGAAFGAISLYGAETREWPDDDIAAAVVMTDMASSYLVHASRLREQEELNQQLHTALDGKAVIEQAKGIVANEHSTTVDHAFIHIRTHARNRNVTVRSVADAIVRLGLRI